MTTLIILIVLITIGALLLKYNYGEFDALGFFVTLLFSVCLVIHSVSWGTSSSDYNLFVAERNVLEQTLIEVRENGNDCETATIVKEVVKLNVQLSVMKSKNNDIFLGQYIDDRIQLLEPIK